jgi:phosphoribosylformylglycinamidine synthase subunit PurQ / glutaminase
MKKIRCLIAAGYGINCEQEMAQACLLAGGEAEIIQIQRLLSETNLLEEYDLLCFPGGFSFGDELGAGKAFANRLRDTPFSSSLGQFVKSGKCILGICNGFQLLVKLGLLPFNQLGFPEMALAPNDSGKFESRWVMHRVADSPSIFLKGIKEIFLPIRHGEGRLVPKNQEALKRMTTGKHVALTYVENPNGSALSTAGLCDSTGRILGMMAHPEAAVYSTQQPDWTRKKEKMRREGKEISEYGDGLLLFKNAINYLRNTP